MRLDLSRHGIDIVPDTIQDEVFIEHILGLTADGDSIPLFRIGIRTDGGEQLLKLHAEKA